MLRFPARLPASAFDPPASRHRRATVSAASLLLGCLGLLGCPGDPVATSAGAPGKLPQTQTAPASTQPAARPGTAAHGTGSASSASTQASTKAGAQAPTKAPAQTLADAAKVQTLIRKAEASFNSGVANYRANRLDAARLDFDTAVDAMLASGLDLKSEGDLHDAFERLVDGINTLEMAALKQGNGFSPKIEEAPLDTADDITFPANPELVAKLKGELNTTSDLPLVINDQVAGYIGIFSSSENFRRHMAASLQRVGKYRGLIQRVLKEEGVPQDLIYLAVAESGFQPQVVNGRSGAGGMWQFMTFTGAEYGLTRNGFFDYRFDPEKSSRAYAKYIKKLYNQFGDWYLAMAAYDWGPAGVQRAVQRTGYADFWELYRRNAMPAETRAYVPQILAAVIMAKNPERYGLDKLVPSPPVIYDTVVTNYGINMRLVADVTEVSVQEIVALNPALLRLETPRDIAFDLHLPPGSKTLYTERLKDIPEDRRSTWRFHIVRAGESLEGIASALHARASEIAETNSITASDPMSPGDELVVPVESVVAAPRPERYTVARGDTLLTIADRFNLSVEDLRRWNAVSSASLRPGRTLFVAEPIRLPSSARARGRGRRGARGARVGRSSRTFGTRTRTNPRAGTRAGTHAPAHGGRGPAHTARSAGSTRTRRKTGR